MTTSRHWATGLVLVIGFCTLFNSHIPLQNPLISIPPGGSSAFAIADFFNAMNNWAYAESPEAIVTATINSGAKYVFVGGSCDNTQYDAYMQQMKSAGLSLGAYLDTWYIGGTQGEKTLSLIVSEATKIVNCGTYDWVDLDHMQGNPDAQQIVNAVSALGLKTWAHYTGWGTGEPKYTVSNPTSGWADFQSDYLFGPWNSNTNYASQPPIQQADINFFNYVRQNNPGTIPVMGLEFGSKDYGKLAALSVSEQEQLLTAWSQGQAQYGYSFVYPIFWAPTPSNAANFPAYDSIAQGTYQYQSQLIQQFNTGQKGTAQSEVSTYSGSSSSYVSSSTETITETTLVSSTITTGGTVLTSTVTTNETTLSSTITTGGTVLTQTSIATVTATSVVVFTVTVFSTASIATQTGSGTTPTMPTVISSFPIEAIIVGIMVGVVLIMIKRRKRG